MPLSRRPKDLLQLTPPLRIFVLLSKKPIFSVCFSKKILPLLLPNDLCLFIPLSSAQSKAPHPSNSIQRSSRPRSLSSIPFLLKPILFLHSLSSTQLYSLSLSLIILFHSIIFSPFSLSRHVTHHPFVRSAANIQPYSPIGQNECFFAFCFSV